MNGSSSVKTDPGGQVAPMGEREQSIVEQAAFALAVARAGEANAEESRLKAGNLWWECKRDVRIVLEAAREPTAWMLGAAYGDVEAQAGRQFDSYEFRRDDVDHASTYRAMIDAALSGAQGEARASTGTPDEP